MSDSNLIAKPKRPLPVTILSWIIFARGILILFVALQSSMIMLTALHPFSTRGFSLWILIIRTMVSGLFDIISSFGLRAMRKWVLYVFIILTGLTISHAISALADNSKLDFISIIDLALSAGTSIYLLVIRKKFV